MNANSQASLNRRRLLQVGCSGFACLSLPTVLSARAKAATQSPSAKRPKSVILILLTGGASHHDTWDLKPEAPDGVRSDFKPIDTRTPGVQICEHLPLLAARSDKLAIVRSMSHGDNGHLPATHTTLTGTQMPLRRASDLDNVLSRRDWPCYGAALDYVRPRHDGVPNGVTLPHRLIEGPLTWPGQHAGFLGGAHDPWEINHDPNRPDFRVDTLTMPEGIGLDRIANRHALLDQINNQRAELAKLAETKAFNEQQEIALTLLTSGKVSDAFRIERETAETRDRYGRHMFGQTLLLSRRLVEAGVPIVQANMGIVQSWDTHVDNFGRLKNALLPPLDRGVSALLDDLAATGLLEETMVVLAGEFGRTPKIGVLPGQSVPGRDHWANVYSTVFAGGGVRGGQVIGRSDKTASAPITRSYRPEDLGATIYHALGMYPAPEIIDPLSRPLPLNRGDVIAPLFSGASV